MTCVLTSLAIVNGLGDQLLALPAVRSIIANASGSAHLLLGEGNYSFLMQDASENPSPWSRMWWKNARVSEIDVDRTLPGVPKTRRFVSLCTWTSDSMKHLVRRLGSDISIGFFDEFATRVEYSPDRHMFGNLFAVAQAAGSQNRFDAYSYPPTFSRSAERVASEWIVSNVGSGNLFIFVHPESSDKRRRWSDTKMAWVLRQFARRFSEYKIVVCSIARPRLDLGAYAKRLIWCDMHLELSLSILAHADIFLGVDSCMLHACDLYGIPGVGLFGPTNPAEWGFRISRNTAHVYGNGDMERIKRAEVLSALLDVKAEVGSSRIRLVSY